MDFCVGNGTNANSPFGKNQFFVKTNGFGQTASSFGQPATNTSIFSTMQPSNNIFQSPNTSTFNPGQSAQAGFGANLFGQQQQQQQPQPSTSGLFGTATAFGQNKTGFGFGANQTQSALFGQQPQQTQQVQQPGQQTQPGASSALFQPNTSNLFGQTTAFGAQTQAGTVIKFSPVSGTDTMQKGGVTQSINTKHHCITCMKVYEGKSFEELRYEDYCANRKGPQQQSGFATPAFGVGQTAPNTSSLFGQTDKTAFGQPTSGFGQTTSTSTFGQNSGGFALANTPSQTNLFAKPANFGGPSSTTFGFNTPAQTANPFSANQQNKPFAQQATLFGSQAQPAQQTGFGTNVFGQNTSQNTNLFQKPSQPTGGFGTGQAGFTFNQPAAAGQTTNLFQANKPNSFGLFGQANTTGIATGFGQPAQQSAFGATTFGKSPIVTGGVTGSTGFGQTGQATGFGTNLTNLQSQQQQTSSLFGNAAPKPTLFGSTNTGTGLFNSSVFQPTQNAFNLQANQQQQQQQSQFFNDSMLNDRNMSMLTTDIYPHGPHGKLDPIFPMASNITTNKDEIQAILEFNRNPEEISLNMRSKIKVQSPKPRRGTNFNREFFESNKSLQGSYKRLVIKKPVENAYSVNIFHKYHDELLQEAERMASAIAVNNNDNINNETNQQSVTPYVNKTKSVVQQTEITPTYKEAAMKGIRLDFNCDLDNTNNNENDNKSDSVDLGKNNSPNDEEDLVLTDRDTASTSNSETSITNVAGVKLTKPEYYMIPPLNKLSEYMNDKGECLVQGLTIGRKGYGNVYFPDEINIKNMNFDEIVYFRHKEIIVYPDDENKPPIGEGLNRRAQVTLDKIFPRLKGTCQYITSVNDIIDGGFVDNLMFVSQKHNSKFVEYRPNTGSWVFKVNHFSKYGLTESDEENCEISPKKLNQPAKSIINEVIESEKFMGLGGQIPMHQVDSETDSNKSFPVDSEFLMPTHSVYDDSVKQRSRIQSMKVSLFQSQIQTQLPATITRPELIEPVLQKPQKIDFTVTPKIHSLVLFHKKKLAKISFMGQRIYSDLSFFKGGSYKVGWMKGGNYFKFKRGYDVTFSHELHSISLNMKFPKEYNRMMPNLEDVLKIALSESVFEYNTKDIPTLKINNDLHFLNKQTNLFNKHASLKDLSGHELYLANVWNLCKALWGKGDDSTFARRRNLSNWLRNWFKDNVLMFMGEDLTQTDIVETIFTLLTYNNVRGAAKMAMDYNLNNLSLLISQLSANKKFKDYIKELVESFGWEEKVPNEIKKIYLLLAGIPKWEEINVCEKLDWKRTFGLYLWYLTPPTASIKYVLEEYKKAFEEVGIAKNPNPPYFIESEYDDLLYQILLLYIKQNGHQLAFVLEPPTHTANRMDFRVSWILMQLFQSLKVGLINNNQKNNLHITFSSQLEHLGLWKWAIFVLLYLDDDVVKKNLIMKILERNLSENNDTLQTENELITLMQLPKDWIYEVKGYKTMSCKMYYDAFQYFLQIGNWNEVNGIFVKHILPELYNYQQENYVRKLLTLVEPGKLQILNWRSQVGLFANYYKLTNLVLNVDSKNHQLVVPMFNRICNRMKRFPLHNEHQKLCIAELSKRCALLFKILFCNMDMDKFNDRYLNFIENMVVPSDFKHYELFYLIGECVASMDY